VNFTEDVLARHDPRALAVVERSRDGGRREHAFADLLQRSASLGGLLLSTGARRGDPVLVLVGNRVEWVEAMLACFRTGLVVLPCSEQLTADDLRYRLDVVGPAAAVVDERNRSVVEAAGLQCPVVLVPDPAVYAGPPAPPADLAADDPCLLTFTSGSTGKPKAVVHGQRYLSGQSLQAEHWLGAREGDLVWCTAATGWSKSARNAFLAPWLRGATALLHDARFDAEERMAVALEESVDVWCMAPTEYRMIERRGALHRLPALHSLVAAGEALDEVTFSAWQEATGLDVRDGYGQTETGQVTANPYGRPARKGSMGLPLPGIEVDVVDGEMLVRADTVPTFFLGYRGEAPPTGWWRTGDRVHRDDDGYLYFESRADDVILSAGYRIGPSEVEDVLDRHPAVADCAVVGARDQERGEVVRAVVVLRDGWAPSPGLVAELQDHVRRHTAPYKYPRVVEFRDQLPRTTSGKVQRAVLRAER
jgi:acyl-coenzyme A synthetase/AMP-(fatty) acid ligase